MLLGQKNLSGWQCERTTSQGQLLFPRTRVSGGLGLTGRGVVSLEGRLAHFARCLGAS